MARTFEVTVDFELDDGIWVAVCREIHIASQGNTLDEAKKNLTEALSLWVDTASKEERDNTLRPVLRRNKSGVFTTRIEVPYGQAAGAIGA